MVRKIGEFAWVDSNPNCIRVEFDTVGDESMSKSTKFTVKDTPIRIVTVEDEDYISLTDMLQAKDGDFFISDWLRNRNTVEFLGIWESVNNPDFNYGEFATIKSQAGLNSYKISVKEWVAKTGAVGLFAKAGRYGGTYAHKDLAFEFGMWISPEFKIYLIMEFQRLKEAERNQLGWDIRRNLARINYRIHTDAIKENLIPPELTPSRVNMVYATEADVLNMALFGMTAKQWRDANPDKGGNIRDYANGAQLVCLANMESLNAHFINENIAQPERLIRLNRLAIQQLKVLVGEQSLHRLERKRK